MLNFDAILLVHNNYVSIHDLHVLQETIMGMLLIPGLH